jgi:hypothetical protein
VQEGTEPAYVGMITAKALQDVLAHAKVGLMRLQVTSVLCDADILDGMADYWKFLPIAAKTIEEMLDPKTLADKAAVMAKAAVAPEDYLNGRSEEELQASAIRNILGR